MIHRIMEQYKTEADLKKEISDSIRQAKRIKNYKGIRHTFNLPVNGQRTRTNAKTQKCKNKK